ncbi:MAG: restriction endonuclease subunit S, partial [Thermoflexales bacterium]|nr:restriction endonuclease subunit S [Thermoflexales bacterium]
MSALQPYPAYKPSGVPWLGDIPAHWQVRRLKFVASVFNSNVDKRSEEGETPVKLCNYIDVYNNERITTDLPFMQATASEREIVKFALRGGDVIITKDSEDWRDIAVPALVVEDLREVICGYHLAVIRPLAGQLDSRYLLRCLQSAAVSYQFQIAATGITRYGLSKQAIGDVVVPCPPLAEQRAITEYLDRETARVDALIARKRALLEQLARWRSAAISHAVTKGLNPDAPLKPSGVPWLGDIPAHWQVRRLKFVAASASEKLEQKPAAVPYLGLENVESWTGKLLLESPQEEVESTVSVFHRGDV